VLITAVLLTRTGREPMADIKWLGYHLGTLVAGMATGYYPGAGSVQQRGFPRIRPHAAGDEPDYQNRLVFSGNRCPTRSPFSPCGTTTARGW
jgi:hypothetical protein